MIHELKIYPQYFDKVISGEKTFEIRKNDRNFHVNDYIALNEFSPDRGYTGRSAMFRISYIGGVCEPPAALPEGYVILGIHPCCFYDVLDVTRVAGDVVKPTLIEGAGDF